ncbi:MAG: type 1 glutamine amidotransferase [Saprospiraceae bacterium]|jgi:type 1 glutamine amidotransferase
MKRIFKVIFRVLLGLTVLLFIAAGLFIYKAKHGINFYESTPPELPHDLSGNTVLIFSKTNGFPHSSAIKAAIPAFKNMADANNWTLYSTNNGAIFNPHQLQQFDVVIWNNVSGKVLNSEQRGHFKKYLEEGGGFVGIHAAGDASHQWDWYEDSVIGARFSHHPINPQLQMAPMQLEKEESDLAIGLSSNWERKDEWYMFYDNPRDKGFDILYNVDESNMKPSGNIPILATDKDWGMGEDHPIVWYHELEKGRVFYSALGHSGRAFKEENHLQLLENAIKWVGRFE